MNNYLKLGLIGLGGSGLFAVTFTMVAVFSGAPLHEIAGLNMFVDPPEGSEDVADADTDTDTPPDPNAPVEPISGAEALKANSGILTVFSVPSPYTGSELNKLQKELTDQFRENRLEREKIRVRQLELDEWETTLTDRYAEMADMRTKLEELESSLDLRQAELTRDEGSYADKELQGWKDLAKLYKGGEAQENAVLIAEEEPEDAALILRELGESQAGEILRLIKPPALRKEYMDAYRAAAQLP